MKKNTLLAWGCGLLAACALPFSGRAVVIYDYNSSASASGFILNSAPTDVGDVGTLQTLSPGQFYQVTSIVVARVNPLRFVKPGKDDARPDFDKTIEKMIDGAKKFDPSKVKAQDVAIAAAVGGGDES